MKQPVSSQAGCRVIGNALNQLHILYQNDLTPKIAVKAIFYGKYESAAILMRSFAGMALRKKGHPDISCILLIRWELQSRIARSDVLNGVALVGYRPS